MRLALRPITLRSANAYVRDVHRHHDAVRGHLWSIAAEVGGAVVGVAIVGRPISKALQDGLTVEVRRVATDGTRNACSFLYGAAWRTAKAHGYVRALTYILKSEPGTSLRAAGWLRGPDVPGEMWDRPSRRRGVSTHVQGQDKVRWQVGAWDEPFALECTA